MVYKQASQYLGQPSFLYLSQLFLTVLQDKYCLSLLCYFKKMAGVKGVDTNDLL